MTNELPERPNLGARRAPRPAPDVSVDPVETVPSAEQKSPPRIVAAEKPNRVPFSNRISEKTLDTLARVKADTKLPIYEAIEIAVAKTWGEYERNK